MKLSNKQLIKIGLLGVVIGIFVVSINYFSEKRDLAFEYMYNELFASNKTSEETENVFEENIVENKEEPINNKEESKTSIKKNNYYIGRLEIPKIGLDRGFVRKDSKDNNVDKNITIIKESTFPDVKGGNFIIAGHSGTGPLAFFNDLRKLQKNDRVYVHYNGNKYAYKIVNIYKQKKTGKIKIYRDKKKTTLTLITCTNNDKNTQTIYIAEQI